MSALPDLSRFDDAEVLPVYEDPDEGTCEPVPDAPHTASFWTVYGRLREGGAHALIDCTDEHSASVAALVLRIALRAPVPGLAAAAQDMLEALQWQEMAEADPDAARRKGYFERARELRRSALAKALENGKTAKGAS
jgi:hypothetical protein